MNLRTYLQSIFYFLVLIISLVGQNYFNQLVIALTIGSLLFIIDKLGRGVILRETIAFLYILTCIFMPYLGYEIYNIHHPLSRLWVGYMPVPSLTYYSFCLPAITAFCLALTWPFKVKFNDEGPYLAAIIQRAKMILANDRSTGIILMIVGMISLNVNNFLPVSVQYVSSILYWISFAGLLYLYFSPPSKYKFPIIILFVLLLILNAISKGLFTVVAYMGLTIVSFFFLRSKISFVKKVSFLLLAVFIMVVVQNTKKVYRAYIWQKGFQGNKTELYSRLFIENLQKGDKLFEENAFFPTYTRTNQGFNVGLVMRRFPDIKPFDGGQALFTVVLSSFVPRFLWADKPEAGGKFNMNYYAGAVIRGWSTNVGPLGEAYASFGITGGVIYMFLIGAFLRWTYGSVFRLASKNPLMVFWIPVLFYQITSSAETDTLQILNSLLKTAFLMWVMFKVTPRWFGKRVNYNYVQSLA